MWQTFAPLFPHDFNSSDRTANGNDSGSSTSTFLNDPREKKTTYVNRCLTQQKGKQSGAASRLRSGQPGIIPSGVWVGPIITACGCGRPRPSAPTRLKPRLGAWKGRVCVSGGQCGDAAFESLSPQKNFAASDSGAVGAGGAVGRNQWRRSR